MLLRKDTRATSKGGGELLGPEGTVEQLEGSQSIEHQIKRQSMNKSEGITHLKTEAPGLGEGVWPQAEGPPTGSTDLPRTTHLRENDPISWR